MRYVALGGLGAVVLGSLVWFELETSRLQSIAASRYAAGIDHWIEAGPNSRLRFPERGPFDRRAGYSELPEMLPRLERRGFTITAQARVSTRFEEVVQKGLFPIYAEKTQVGLELLDRDGRPIFAYLYPERVLQSFESIPPLLVTSLLYVENRELLDATRPYRNPAVEWDRLAMMALRLGRRSVGDDSAVQGASTLATQLEKFRHSPGGMTQTPAEKARQMASASLRAYRDGRATLGARQRIVVDYLNGLPLAAVPSHGEVHGLLDGLWLWYGIDREELELLREPIAAERLPRAASVYRAALSLMLATRRPAFYLGADGGRELERLCDAYTRLLANQGFLAEPLARAVLEVRLERRHTRLPARDATAFEQKAANAVRADLLGLLGVENLYGLDRLDLTVSTSIDAQAQTAVARELRELQSAERREDAGLTGPRLLPARDAISITYSILLCEATAQGNQVRVQTDNHAGPRDVNRHTKLELGSTAKLRTLVSYLEIIEALYERLGGASPEAVASYLDQFDDPLTKWMASALEETPRLTLEEALAKALARRYSASPTERFFTAGGVHRFSNFDRADDSRMPTVQEGLSQSVNLVFIRVMRDIVRFHEQRIPLSRNVAADPLHPMRSTYLARFAYREGQQFIRRFHARHAGLTPAASIDLLLGKSVNPLRIARVRLAVLPDTSVEDLGSLLRERLVEPLPSDSGVDALHRRARSERLPLADLAHVVNADPLELWVIQYLAAHPRAGLSDTIAAADAAIEAAYRWLFRTRRKELQDARIRTILEVEAFARIHESWRALGYPFPFLVPSYATAIGSSGDRPEALADLVGVLVNDGIRRPTIHVTGLQFGAVTPFETRLAREPQGDVRVLSPAVARAARQALADVVDNGTGRRVRDVFFAADGAPLPIGGKTGTGDNRRVVVDWRGERIASYARNRTASFVFYVGNHFGVVTAHVDGADADDYAFTSALPVQILRHLAPQLAILLQRDDTPLLSSQVTTGSYAAF